MLQFKLPAAHSVRIPVGKAQGFSPFVLLGRAAILGHEEDDGLQGNPRAGCPCGEGGDGREKPTNQLHTCLVAKVIEEIRNFLEWGGGTLGWDHQVGGCGFSDRGFDTRGCFLLALPSSLLRGCCGFGLRLLRPARFPGGGHFRLIGRLRDNSHRGLTLYSTCSGAE